MLYRVILIYIYVYVCISRWLLYIYIRNEGCSSERIAGLGKPGEKGRYIEIEAYQLIPSRLSLSLPNITLRD